GVRQNTFPGEVRGTAGPSAPLPRISCGTWWRWCTSCAFPLQKGAYAALSSAAWQEIRVRSGRDDTSIWVLSRRPAEVSSRPERSEVEGPAVLQACPGSVFLSGLLLDDR